MILQDAWARVMEKAKQTNRPVWAFLLEATPVAVDGDCVILAVRHRFHLEGLRDPRNRLVVEEVVRGVMGVPRVAILPEARDGSVKGLTDRAWWVVPIVEGLCQPVDRDSLTRFYLGRAVRVSCVQHDFGGAARACMVRSP